MSSTIFCTFDQRDLADLAMGQLRQIPGVTGIRYVIGQTAEGRNHGAVQKTAHPYGLWGSIASEGMSTQPIPSEPAGIKITCDESVRKRVESVLINMHAYRIVSAP